MPAPHGRPAGGVIARLLAAPQEFEFVQAVRLLLGWLAEQGVAPAVALRTHLRFENSLHLGFPPGEIEALACERDAAGDGEAAAPMRVRLTPTFMGLLGVHGALPAHFTERIASWQAAHGDEAPRAFLDLLSGRMLALYYAAWFKYRVEEAVDGGADRLRPMLLALAGCAPGSARAAAVPEALPAHFAGLLARRPVNGVVLARLLGSYFAVPMALDEAVGHWRALDGFERSAVGVNARLGRDTALGPRSWRPDLRARLRIGPLNRAAFERFLPGGEAAAMLARILRLLAPPCIEFEVRLTLRAADVQPGRLGGDSSGAARLGRDSFVLSAAARRDRTDVRYVLVPMAPMPPLAPPSRRRA